MVRDFWGWQNVISRLYHGVRCHNTSWLVALGLIGMLAVGCSRKTYWYHPDRTLAQAEQDCRECYQQAQTEAAETGRTQRLDNAEVQGESADEQWSYAYQDVQFRRGMKRRGYHLVQERQLDASVEKRVLRMGGIQSFPIAGH
jgi:hypothetical protein